MGSVSWDQTNKGSSLVVAVSSLVSPHICLYHLFFFAVCPIKVSLSRLQPISWFLLSLFLPELSGMNLPRRLWALFMLSLVAPKESSNGDSSLSLVSILPSSSCPRMCLVFSLTVGAVTIDKSDPSSVEALVGQTVVLPCRVSPPPSSTVSVEWRRDGVPLSSSRSGDIQRHHVHT